MLASNVRLELWGQWDFLLREFYPGWSQTRDPSCGGSGRTYRGKFNLKNWTINGKSKWSFEKPTPKVTEDSRNEHQTTVDKMIGKTNESTKKEEE